jgi:hypothetical protein
VAEGGGVFLAVDEDVASVEFREAKLPRSGFSDWLCAVAHCGATVAFDQSLRLHEFATDERS